VVTVVAMMVLSGCVGFGGADTADASASETGDASAGGTGETGDASAGGTGDVADDGVPAATGGSAGDPSAIRVDSFDEAVTPAQLDDYIDRSGFVVLRPGEYFRFEGQTGRLSGFETLEPVTVEVQSGAGGEWLEANATVTVATAAETVTFTENEPAFLFNYELTSLANGRTFVFIFQQNEALERGQLGREIRISDLQVGQTWQYRDPQAAEDGQVEGLDFAVTENRRYAGLECAVIEVDRVEDEERYRSSETCLSPETGYPLYMASYQNDGALMVELELSEYRRS
jgi:hypothetical protein